MRGGDSFLGCFEKFFRGWLFYLRFFSLGRILGLNNFLFLRAGEFLPMALRVFANKKKGPKKKGWKFLKPCYLGLGVKKKKV